MRISLMLFRLGFAGLLAAGLQSPAAAQTYTCVSGTDDAEGLRDYIVALVTASAAFPDFVQTRDVYQLPGAIASAVTIETRRQVCDRAGVAYHRVYYPREPEVSRTLVVIKVGNNRYVVLDRNERAGEYSVVAIFDGKWKHLESFTG